MVKRLWPILLALAMVAPAAWAAGEASSFAPVPGDRVVFLGNTFIERDQTYGYLEAGLTLRHPGRPILFRNLGWSGDTVFGEARASFDPPPVGYQRLKDHVLALKPTVIFVGYGGVESFDGPAGLPRFRAGLKTLLDALAETKARIILISPLRHEDLGRPLPDPAGHNVDLRAYVDAIRQMALDRHHEFLNLFDLKPAPPRPLTDDGLHPTAFGYWYLAHAISRGAATADGQPGAADRWDWRLSLDADRANEADRRETTGMALSKVQATPSGISFQVLDDTLPFPPPPAGTIRGTSGEPDHLLKVTQLPAGRYTLKVDGKPTYSGLAAPDLAKGVGLQRGPEWDQVERLRAAIVKKNLLYFYRWRPQNETYLFGFRKHEQGRNAAEIVQFDPLIAEQEGIIAGLSVPVAHTYELSKEDGKDGR